MLFSPLFCDEAPGWPSFIQDTWNWLHPRGHHKVEASIASSITIERSRGWELSALKRIAQGLIYFEPAWELLAPDDKMDCQRLWRHNPVLQHKSRSEAIAAVENLSSISELTELIRQDPGGPPYHFSFHDNVDGSEELTLACPCLHVAPDAVHWAKFTMSFIRACMSGRRLTRYAISVEGLRLFVTGRRTPEGSHTALYRSRVVRGQRESTSGSKQTLTP